MPEGGKEEEEGGGGAGEEEEEEWERKVFVHLFSILF